MVRNNLPPAPVDSVARGVEITKGCANTGSQMMRYHTGNENPVRVRSRALSWRQGALGLVAALLLAVALLPSPVAASTAIYIPMAPPFVVNYGGQGRLKYLQAEISVRVDNVNDAAAVRYHMPLFRNAIVLLLSRQDEEMVNTQEGRERLRQLALDEINDLLEQEEGRRGVTGLYFNNIVVQR